MDTAIATAVAETVTRSLAEVVRPTASDGLIARTYERLGGDDHFLSWAEKYPTKFYQLMFAQMPPVKEAAPNITLKVDARLQPTELDVTGTVERVAQSVVAEQ